MECCGYYFNFILNNSINTFYFIKHFINTLYFKMYDNTKKIKIYIFVFYYSKSIILYLLHIQYA